MQIRNHLINMLTTEHSKSQMQAIVNYIDGDAAKFNELVKIFLTGEYRIIQRASWPLSNCIDRHPALAKKHLEKLFRHMKDAKQHPAVRRNVMRIFDIVTIPKNMHGELMNESIDCIANPSEAVAVQAFALGILQKLTKFYPEIRYEVELIIESRMPGATPAFSSRAKKYMRETAQKHI